MTLSSRRRVFMPDSRGGAPSGSHPPPGTPLPCLSRMQGMDTRIATPDSSAPGVGSGVPEKPTLDGLEEKWIARWAADDTYSFDRAAAMQAPREQIYSIDTPPPTASGSLHVGHVFSFSHTDFVARYQRMRGKHVFYPMGWDDNGLPTERRGADYYGGRCDPSPPYHPPLLPLAKPDKTQL